MDSNCPNKVKVVLGAQWGDEGKGKLVDLLAEHADVVARCQVSTVGKIYTPIFSFFGKELSISRFESWDRSQMKGQVILHSQTFKFFYF